MKIGFKPGLGLAADLNICIIFSKTGNFCHGLHPEEAAQ